jgi:hypothetical protein
LKYNARTHNNIYFLAATFTSVALLRASVALLRALVALLRASVALLRVSVALLRSLAGVADGEA